MEYGEELAKLVTRYDLDMETHTLVFDNCGVEYCTQVIISVALWC